MSMKLSQRNEHEISHREGTLVSQESTCLAIADMEVYQGESQNLQVILHEDGVQAFPKEDLTRAEMSL